MSRVPLHLTVFVCFAIQLSSSSTSTVVFTSSSIVSSPESSTIVSSSTTQTTGLPPSLTSLSVLSVAPSSPVSAFFGTVSGLSTASSSISFVQSGSASSTVQPSPKPTATQSSSVHTTASPGSPAKPTSRVPSTTTQGTQGTKGKSVGPLETVGFTLLAILLALVIAFAIYFVFFRKRVHPEYWNKLEAPPPAPSVAAAEVSAVTTAAAGERESVGITHEGFEADLPAPSPINEAPPAYPGAHAQAEKKEEITEEAQVDGKNVENAEKTQEEVGVDNAGLVEDSAL